MGQRLDEEMVKGIVRAARECGRTTVSLRIWTNAEFIVIHAPAPGETTFAVRTRIFSDDPVWNPPARVVEQTLTEAELITYLLGRTLELDCG